MACKKTLNLTGTEQKVEFKGRHCDVRNDGAGVVYVSCTPGVVADADGVLSIPPGQAVKYCGCRGVLYLLGEGKVLLCGNDYSTQVFRGAATSAGSGEGGVSQTYVDMQDADVLNRAKQYAEGIISNPNLLDNPDFSINQRGLTSYINAGYTVDRWILSKMSSVASIGTVAVGAGGVTLTGTTDAQSVRFMQKLENEIPEGTPVTMSVYVEEVTGSWALSQFGGVGRKTITEPGWHTLSTTWTYQYSSSLNSVLLYNNEEGSLTVSKIKLEYGTSATAFVPPNPSLELLRCQRYYQIRTEGGLSPADLRPSMRTITPTIAQLDGGNYAYSADL